MKLMKRVLWMLPVFSLGAIAIPTNVSAQCAIINTSVQANVSGSRTPASQTNSSDMRSKGPCTGTVNRTHTTQTNVGDNRRSIQSITDEQEIKPGSKNPSGVDGTTVKLRANPTIDVYNPADRD